MRAQSLQFAELDEAPRQSRERLRMNCGGIGGFRQAGDEMNWQNF